jgi:hypothetical protein
LQEHLRASTTIAVLVEIAVPNGSVYRYQNYQPEQFAWGGKLYDYAPFQWNGAPKNLDLDNVSATLVLPNLPPIRFFVQENDGLRKTSFTITEFFPKNANAAAVPTRLQGRSSRIQKAEIEIQLQSPMSAIGAIFPGVSFRTGAGLGRLDLPGLIPELPRQGIQVRLQ